MNLRCFIPLSALLLRHRRSKRCREIRDMYKALVRPAFFSMDPENAHDVMRFGAKFANNRLVSGALRSLFQVWDPRLAVHVAGISFPNPIGLAAGLDKNAELVGLCAGLGFGHLELGTVTAKAQPGNPKPRIFRLAKDEALINRMGFPSGGADEMEHRLKAIRHRFPALPPIGINIGKSKVTEIDDAIDDYQYSFQKLAPYADYITVNVSSPNTPNLRQLQERERLQALLETLRDCNVHKKPIFVKVAPDLTWSAIEEVIECCISAGVAGLIATNTTLGREGLVTPISETGGLSGAPLRKRALEVVQFIGSRLQGRLALIGVGGISSPSDVLAMLAAGASMVQVYTSLIYEGPGLVKALNRGLLEVINREGCRSIYEAAGLLSKGSQAASSASSTVG
jgi:dihydroorotate dehydrogenase